MTVSDEPWTIRRLLEWTASFFKRKDVESPRLCAELLLSHVLCSPRIKLYTNYENAVTARQLDQFRALVKRAGEHEPIAYLTGKAHFFNLEIDVTPDVLIPRPDTEVLVENAVRIARTQAGMETPRVLDLCTGSGCVALAIATNLPRATIIAADISARACEVARRNVKRLALETRVSAIVEGDLFDALADLPDKQPFDLIVANPPYIPTGQIASLDKNVRDYEPRSALDGGEEGLEIHRRILAQASEYLVAGGHVLLEIAFDQADAAMALMNNAPGVQDGRIFKDYSGRPRVLAAQKPAN